MSSHLLLLSQTSTELQGNSSRKPKEGLQRRAPTECILSVGRVWDSTKLERSHSVHNNSKLKLTSISERSRSAPVPTTLKSNMEDVPEQHGIFELETDEMTNGRTFDAQVHEEVFDNRVKRIRAKIAERASQDNPGWIEYSNASYKARRKEQLAILYPKVFGW